MADQFSCSHGAAVNGGVRRRFDPFNAIPCGFTGNHFSGFHREIPGRETFVHQIAAGDFRGKLTFTVHTLKVPSIMGQFLNLIRLMSRFRTSK